MRAFRLVNIVVVVLALLLALAACKKMKSANPVAPTPVEPIEPPVGVVTPGSSQPPVGATLALGDKYSVAMSVRFNQKLYYVAKYFYVRDDGEVKGANSCGGGYAEVGTRTFGGEIAKGDALYPWAAGRTVARVQMRVLFMKEMIMPDCRILDWEHPDVQGEMELNWSIPK